MSEEYKYENRENRGGRMSVNLKEGLTFIGVGAAVGAILALLFAPKSGVELRSDIVDVSRKGLDATVDKATNLRDASTRAVDAIKEKAATIYDFATEKLNGGTEAVTSAITSTTEAISDTIERTQTSSGKN